MIIREQGNNLLLITQPDHAEIAGIFADHWKVTAFRGYDKLEEVLLAVHSHDDCWRDADKKPLLNKETGVPYSFDEYPERPKISFYKKGIDQMEADRPYAALLCSRHFASFFATDKRQRSQEYYHFEILRQHKLIQQLHIKERETEQMEFHFRLLQFCDNLSLFICLNEGGKDQHPWFKKGFLNSERLGLSKQPLKANWENPRTLKLSHSPFDETFAIQLKYRIIPYPGSQNELDRSWKEAKIRTEEITIS